MDGQLLLFLHPFRVTSEESVDNLGLCLQSSGRYSSPFQWLFFQPSGMVSSIFRPDLLSTRPDIISPVVWKIFFTFSMNISPAFWNGFFYSSMGQVIQSNVLESFLQLTYEKRKRDFKWMYISYYLNALQDIFRFFWRLHLFLAFLLLSVLSSIKQFTNFYNYEELWGLCTNSFPFLRYLLSQS